jgi:tripartite ATP-independent transporter DctP family solute receptor
VAEDVFSAGLNTPGFMSVNALLESAVDLLKSRIKVNNVARVLAATNNREIEIRRCVMRMNKWITLGILLGLLVTLVAAGCNSGPKAPAAPSQIVLKAADIQPEDYPTIMGMKYMAKLLDERTSGRIKMQVYGGAQLGQEKETIEMTQAGTIAFNRINASPLVSFSSAMGVYSMPYLFRDEDHLWKVLNGPTGKGLLKGMESSNLVGLAYYDSGARSFYTKGKPIKTLADMKGMKIRVQQSKIFVDLVNTLGGSATPMNYGEIYSGLQTGIIDGAENNPPSLWTSKHYEVAKYYSLDEHSMVPEVLLISKKVWDGLSANDQKLIAQAAQDSVAEQRKLWNELVQKSMNELVAKGTVIIKPDKAPFQKAVQPVYAKYPEYKELISQIQAVK